MADVTRPETLNGICQSVDTVISVIGITRLKGKLSHMDVDYQGNMNLLHEAQRAGVKKFVFISPAGTDLGAEAGIPLMKAKFMFEEALKVSGLNWVIVHASGFIRDFAEMAKMAKTGPMYIIGEGSVVTTPVDVHDLAVCMASDALERSNCYTSIGGPRDMTWKEICEACFDVWGKPAKIIKMPPWACRMALHLLRFISPENYALGKLLYFYSVTSIPTQKRGVVDFKQYLKNTYAP